MVGAMGEQWQPEEGTKAAETIIADGGGDGRRYKEERKEEMMPVSGVV